MHSYQLSFSVQKIHHFGFFALKGLLNDYFNGPSSTKFHRLPFTYNMTSGSIYTYKAAYKKFGKDVKIVHFLGQSKPWKCEPSNKGEHLGAWKDLYHQSVQQHIPSQYQPRCLTSEEHRATWESGKPEYWGRDAFDNIDEAIERSLKL
uniref:Uncharacterized protein n=1 Tax=Rhabditophanes sp. KR3021 TaxID=114890 RepID=A0AC35UE19_9BILA